MSHSPCLIPSRRLPRLRIAALFFASAIVSFGALLVAKKSGSAQASVEPGGIPVYDAAKLARGGVISRTIRSSDPGVIVVRNVSSFAALLQLRENLGLYGYSAAMSNFYCGSLPGVPAQPVDIGVLSRQPIEEAAEYDAPGANCVIPGPFVAGPGVAVHEKRTISPRGWPRVSQLSDKPMPGPGVLAVRISGEAQPLVLVRLPTMDDYPVEDTAAVEKMRAALQEALLGKSFAGCRTSGCQTVTIDPDASSEPTIRTAMR
ncbi:MAG TPA: hypothetical protein VGM17_18665 [Rhizomicrobium sp.]